MFKIDTGKIGSLEEKKFLEEKLGNRIVLNVLYTITAYILLFICYNFSTGFNGSNPLVMKPMVYALIAIFFFFLLASAVFYIWSAKTEKADKKSLIRNHAHMFAGFAAGAFLVNLPKYLQIIPLESTSGIIRTLLQYLKNTVFDYKLTAVLIAIVFVVLCVLNFMQYRELAKINKKTIAKK